MTINNLDTTYRQASFEDIPRILIVIWAVIIEPIKNDEVARANASNEFKSVVPFITDYVMDQEYVTFVACYNSLIVAVLVVSMFEEENNTDAYCFVNILYVHPDFQNMKIGTSLLEQAEYMAIANNCTQISLTPLDRTRFYPSRGYSMIQKGEPSEYYFVKKF
jgi:GNAT superfamily N-acetyltransferase